MIEKIQLYVSVEIVLRHNNNVRDGPKRGRTIDVYGFSSFIIVAGKTTL